jgi:4-hydroxy-tetrahydrodipicolinate reductase
MRIAIAGHSGRVGKELIRLILESDPNLNFSFVGGWNSEGPKMVGADADSLNMTPGWNGQLIDIVIDFSLPETFPKILKWCQDNNKPLVSGVTGLGELNQENLNKIMGANFKLKAPLFWASNMSIGIALVKKFIEMAKIFNPSEFTISETHHIHKKDSPSGTALSLAHVINNNFNLKQSVPIEAIRKEEVFGIHEVTFKSDDEVLRIYHEAMNRKVFASGALKVSEWMFNNIKDARLYSMEDFIRDVKKS